MHNWLHRHHLWFLPGICKSVGLSKNFGNLIDIGSTWDRKTQPNWEPLLFFFSCNLTCYHSFLTNDFLILDSQKHAFKPGCSSALQPSFPRVCWTHSYDYATTRQNSVLCICHISDTVLPSLHASPHLIIIMTPRGRCH